MQLITKEFLEFNSASKGLILFMEQNGLLGLPLDYFTNVTGDYNGYIKWLQNLSKDVKFEWRKCRDTGNYEVLSHYHDNFTSVEFFNEQGICLLYFDNTGLTIKNELDDHGNVIVRTENGKKRLVYTYDEHGNPLTCVRNGVLEWEMSYDEDSVPVSCKRGDGLSWKLYRNSDRKGFTYQDSLGRYSRTWYARGFIRTFMDDTLYISESKKSEDGLLLGINDGKGIVIRNSYDGGNLMSAITYTGYTLTDERQYDYLYHETGQLKCIRDTIQDDDVLTLPLYKNSILKTIGETL